MCRTCVEWKPVEVIATRPRQHNFLVGNYMLKADNRNTKLRCEICSKLTIKTPERDHWRCSGAFIVNFWIYFAPCSRVSIANLEQEIPTGLSGLRKQEKCYLYYQKAVRKSSERRLLINCPRNAKKKMNESTMSFLQRKMISIQCSICSVYSLIWSEYRKIRNVIHVLPYSIYTLG